MQNREQIEQLFKRYQEGKCNPDEKAQLHAWFNDYASREASGLDELVQAYDTSPVSSEKSRRLTWMYWAAAAIVIIVGGTFLWKYSVNEKAKITMESIVPGGNKAVLTLADGRNITLNPDQSGISVSQGRISYYSGTDIANLNSGGQLPEDVELVLTTPNGGTYQVTLSDGTKVWLNAGSKLRYPLKFKDEERLVHVEGEAYFDVESVRKNGLPGDKVPFIVKSKGQQVQVLGTEFNLSAYGDETAVKTTLVEGKVRLRDSDSGTSLLLLPGQQSAYKTGEFIVHAVNTEQYTAWKNGEFHFDNTPFTEMMRQVARWFDIEVVYEGEPPAEVFSGVMSRSVSLQTLLELLKLSEVQYRLENKKLIIK